MISEQLKKIAQSFFDDGDWLRLIHHGTKPAYTHEEKQANVELAKNSNHCATCLNINGCCFPKDNCPPLPIHPKCHCETKSIDRPKITADANTNKFLHYLFNKDKSNGKTEMFESWGFSVNDSKLLSETFVAQAEENYANGNFILGELNKYGQRIKIPTTLNNKYNNKKITFKTGWLVYPDGNIKLATPYGAK